MCFGKDISISTFILAIRLSLSLLLPVLFHSPARHFWPRRINPWSAHSVEVGFAVDRSLQLWEFLGVLVHHKILVGEPRFFGLEGKCVRGNLAE